MLQERLNMHKCHYIAELVANEDLEALGRIQKLIASIGDRLKPLTRIRILSNRLNLASLEEFVKVPVPHPEMNLEGFWSLSNDEAQLYTA
jgi:hypothetical protein